MGREGTGVYLKNHEGYHDPTAYRGIERVRRRKRKKESHLYYYIGEIPSFPAILK